MQMKNNWFFILLVVLTIGFTIYFGKAEKTAIADEKPEIGFKAPSFSLEVLHSDQRLSLQNTKNPVVINFWASWCGPCRLEAPDLVRLHEEYKGEIEVYAINLTDSDTMRGVEQFVEEFGFEFPVLLDRDGAVGNTYRVMAIPTTYFINADGIVENKIVGYAAKADLEYQFQKLAGK